MLPLLGIGKACLRELARIVHEELLPFRTIRRKGFDSGLFRPSLRASLERVRKHPVETCNKDSSLFAGAYSRIL